MSDVKKIECAGDVDYRLTRLRLVDVRELDNLLTRRKKL